MPRLSANEAASRSNSARDVLLVSMPFAHPFSPSIGLSLLRPQIERIGLSCEILYLNLVLANRLGKDCYSRFAIDQRGSFRDFVGEWVFSGTVFDRPASSERPYIDDILIGRQAWSHKASARRMTKAGIAEVLRVKRLLPGFLDECLERVLAASPRVIGFTSVFQQHVASLALARLIKARRPEVLIVFGGANCEGVMGAETLRQFPFVDAVVSGEGDLVFPDLVRRFIDGAAWSDVPGVLTQSTVKRAFMFGRFPNAPVVTDLDALPHPDFSDFFKQYVTTRFLGRWKPNIYVETSRGCWWGERMHCTFCGLNGATMTFRSKSPERAYSELETLSATYPGCRMQVVDNILDLKYFDTLLPALAAGPLDLDLFYETKANLKKDQIRTLRAAGVTAIQPGVESLSTQVLKVMKKGISGLLNLQLLKWCKEIGVEPRWNFIFGFPGESPAEYARIADLVPLLVHLPPPGGIAPIRLDRFSPNFTHAEEYGFTNVRPLAPYRFVYDVPDHALQNLAYYFAHDYAQPMDLSSYVAGVEAQLKTWRRVAGSYELLAIDDGDVLTLVDTRPRATPVVVLTGLDRSIYLACDAVTDLERLERALPPASRAAIADRLASMVARRIVLEDAGQYLALAVPLGDYVPRGAAAERVMQVLASEGRRRNRVVRVTLCEPRSRRELARMDARMTARGELRVRIHSRVA
jgi:ribosomal peptide maturation radical SAM protein 1